jgi:hydroxyacylglutathione hydrolase
VKQLADGVWHLNTVPLPNAVNAYLLEDVLVDAGTRQSRRTILRQLERHDVSTHALTHAHPDHQGASHEVSEALGIPGDEVAGFKVLDVPGHSAGHIVFWRESDGVLVLGDVLANMDQLTLIHGLHEPKPYLTPDPEENRRSARKLAVLEPKLVAFGHGAPLRDTKKFVDFVEALPG